MKRAAMIAAGFGAFSFGWCIGGFAYLYWALGSDWDYEWDDEDDHDWGGSVWDDDYFETPTWSEFLRHQRGDFDQ